MKQHVFLLFLVFITSTTFAKGENLLAVCSCKINRSCYNVSTGETTPGHAVQTFGIYKNETVYTSILITIKKEYFCDSPEDFRQPNQPEHPVYNAFGDITQNHIKVRFMNSQGDYVGAIKASGLNNLTGYVWDWIFSDNGQYDDQNATCETECVFHNEYHSWPPN